MITYTELAGCLFRFRYKCKNKNKNPFNKPFYKKKNFNWFNKQNNKKGEQKNNTSV